MEPENRGTVLALLKAVHRRYPQKDIWCYTGYDYEKDLLAWAGGCAAGRQEGAESGRAGAPDSEINELLTLIDVLVDGEFVEAQKNLRLAFRGSENQRLIDVKKSLQAGKTICLPA